VVDIKVLVDPRLLREPGQCLFDVFRFRHVRCEVRADSPTTFEAWYLLREQRAW
jgi:hypothetical protein